MLRSSDDFGVDSRTWQLDPVGIVRALPIFMPNEPEVSPASGPSRRTAVAWEIVCPDGGVRHFPYSSKDDAEYDASLCIEEGCQIFPESYALGGMRPPCAGGSHRIVRAKPSHRDSNVSGELGRPASP